jgi:hypothetical protein
MRGRQTARALAEGGCGAGGGAGKTPQLGRHRSRLSLIPAGDAALSRGLACDIAVVRRADATGPLPGQLGGCILGGVTGQRLIVSVAWYPCRNLEATLGESVSWISVFSTPRMSLNSACECIREGCSPEAVPDCQTLRSLAWGARRGASRSRSASPAHSATIPRSHNSKHLVPHKHVDGPSLEKMMRARLSPAEVRMQRMVFSGVLPPS